MRRWSIKGFHIEANNRSYFSDDEIAPDDLADPSRRLSDTGPLLDKHDEPLPVADQLAATIAAETHEPDRILIRMQLDNGRNQYAWIYLKDFGTSWDRVDWDEIEAYLGEHYDIGKGAYKPPYTPTPPPQPKPKPFVPAKPKVPFTQPEPPKPLRPRKRTAEPQPGVVRRIVNGIQRLFRRP